MLTFAIASLSFAVFSPGTQVDLKDYFRKAYERPEPVQFITTINCRMGFSNHIRVQATVMKTVYQNKTNYRVDRRDAWTSGEGTSGSSSGVLWVKDGKVRIWFKAGDSVTGSTRDVEQHEFNEEPSIRGSSGRLRDFIFTRQHQLLFGKFEWLTGNWNSTGLVYKRSNPEFGGQTETITRMSAHRGYLSEESFAKPSIYRAPIDGYEITVSHHIHNAVKPTTDFSPPN